MRGCLHRSEPGVRDRRRRQAVVRARVVRVGTGRLRVRQGLSRRDVQAVANGCVEAKRHRGVQTVVDDGGDQLLIARRESLTFDDRGDDEDVVRCEVACLRVRQIDLLPVPAERDELVLGEPPGRRLRGEFVQRRKEEALGLGVGNVFRELRRRANALRRREVAARGQGRVDVAFPARNRVDGCDPARHLLARESLREDDAERRVRGRLLLLVASDRGGCGPDAIPATASRTASAPSRRAMSCPRDGRGRRALTGGRATIPGTPSRRCAAARASEPGPGPASVAGEALVEAFDRDVDGGFERFDEPIRLFGLRAVLAAEGQRKPDHDPGPPPARGRSRPAAPGQPRLEPAGRLRVDGRSSRSGPRLRRPCAPSHSRARVPSLQRSGDGRLPPRSASPKTFRVAAARFGERGLSSPTPADVAAEVTDELRRVEPAPDQRLVEVHDEVCAAVVDRADDQPWAFSCLRKRSERSRSSPPLSALASTSRTSSSRSTIEKSAAVGRLRRTRLLADALELAAELVQLPRPSLEQREGLARRTASIRRVPAPTDDSDRIANGPISAVQRTCVPPHSSAGDAGDLDHAHLVAVLLAEEHHRAELARLLDRRDERADGEVLEHPFVDDLLDRLALVRRSATADG